MDYNAEKMIAQMEEWAEEDKKFKLGLPHIPLKEFEERIKNISIKNRELKQIMLELEGWYDLPAHLLQELFKLVGAAPIPMLCVNNISKTDWDRERKKILQYRDDGCTDSGKFMFDNGCCQCSRCEKIAPRWEFEESVYCRECQGNDDERNARYERENLNDHYIRTRGFK